MSINFIYGLMNSDLQDYDTSLLCIYFSHMHTTLYWQLISNSGNCRRDSKKSFQVKKSWLRKQGTPTKNRYLSRYPASEKTEDKNPEEDFFYQLESEGSNRTNEPGTSTLVQLRRIRTRGRDFEVPTHPYAPLLTRGQGIKNLPQIEETMRIGTWRTRAVERWKRRKRGVKTETA